MRMVGMIPMPDAQYAAAMNDCLSQLRAAITPMGLNAANLAPPPARMMPVVEDQAGNRYVLVETCNTNFRPTALPLAALGLGAATGGDASQPAAPDGFIPLDSLQNLPDPPADGNLQAAGGQASALVSKLMQAMQGRAASSQAPGVLPSSTSLPSADFISAASFVNPPAPTAHSAPLGMVPQLPVTPTSRHSGNHESAGRNGEVSPEENTRNLLRLAGDAAKASGRPDATGGLAPTILGIAAGQNPKSSSAAFERMLAEKAAGFAPTGGIYRRLQSALAAIPQNPGTGS
jgi:hypothetical protein